MIVTTPDAHVVLEDSVIVTGTTTVADVNANSFVSEATHTGGITVTDANNSRLVLNGNASAANVTLNTSGNVNLGGSYTGEVTIKDSAKVNLEENTNIAYLSIESNGIQISGTGTNNNS